MLALGLMCTNTDDFGKKIAPESRILTKIESVLLCKQF